MSSKGISLAFKGFQSLTKFLFVKSAFNVNVFFIILYYFKTTTFLLQLDCWALTFPHQFSLLKHRYCLAFPWSYSNVLDVLKFCCFCSFMCQSTLAEYVKLLFPPYLNWKKMPNYSVHLSYLPYQPLWFSCWKVKQRVNLAWGHREISIYPIFSYPPFSFLWSTFSHIAEETRLFSTCCEVSFGLRSARGDKCFWPVTDWYLCIYSLHFHLESLHASATLLRWWIGDLGLQCCSRPYPFHMRYKSQSSLRAFLSLLVLEFLSLADFSFPRADQFAFRNREFGIRPMFLRDLV